MKLARQAASARPKPYANLLEKRPRSLTCWLLQVGSRMKESARSQKQSFPILAFDFLAHEDSPLLESSTIELRSQCPHFGKWEVEGNDLSGHVATPIWWGYSSLW